MSLHILVVDDHDAVRRVGCSLLQTRQEWQVCGEARGLFEASSFSSNGADVVSIEGSLFQQSAESDYWSPGARFLVFAEASANEIALERILSSRPECNFNFNNFIS